MEGRAMESCDEHAEYIRRCSVTHDTLAKELTASHGQRALYFEFGLRGYRSSQWGLGHVLPAVFLMHDICRQLNRYCYIKVFNMDLHKLMKYAAHNLSWGVPDALELARYGTDRGAVQNGSHLLPFDGNLLQAFGTPVITRLRAPDVASRRFVHLRTKLPPGEFAGHLFLPVLPGERRTRLTNPRCFCRFVTEPLIFYTQPSTAAGGSSSAQDIVYHLRTGYADIPDMMLHELEAQRAGLEGVQRAGLELARWVHLACPQPLAVTRLRDVTVLTDSPALRAVLQTEARPGLHDGQQRSGQNEPTRSWRAPFAAKTSAFADLVAASLVRPIPHRPPTVGSCKAFHTLAHRTLTRRTP